METRLPATSSPDYDAAGCSASPLRRGFQPRHPQTTTRRNAQPLHGDAASSRVTSKEMRHLLESPDRSTTSLTRHILPNSETPNSESNRRAAVEKREAQGEVVTKPLSQPSELKEQRGQSPIFSARHWDNYTQGVRRSATDIHNPRKKSNNRAHARVANGKWLLGELLHALSRCVAERRNPLVPQRMVLRGHNRTKHPPQHMSRFLSCAIHVLPAP